MNRREILTILVLLALCVLVVILRLSAGHNEWGISSNEQIMGLRWNRVIVGGLVGFSLGVSGTLLQSLLRNPLASPDLMGLSAGAGFAVTLVTLLSGGMIGAAMAAFPALVGSFIVLIALWIMSQRRGALDPVMMILIGVMISITLGAGTMLLASLMPDRGFSVSRWMMGGLREDISHTVLGIIAGCLGLITIWSLIVSRGLDAMALSEDEASSSGVRVGRLRLGQLIGSGVLTTMSIVLAGPIGFVGLVCPHFVRLIAGPSHRVLILGSGLAGFILLIGADTLVRLITTDAGRIPIGVITALIGGPVFLIMLIRQRGYQSIR